MPTPPTPLMRAVEISAPGGPDVLRLTQRPIPVPGPGEVRIKVAAAGINRPDCLQRQGLYPPPPGASDLPGLEVAGTIDALGPGAEGGGDGWRIGDAVCALLAGGGYAEYAVAPVGQCLPVPAGLTMPQAAAIPETFFTVWTNVFQRGELVAGERFLVHGGASGIGSTAIQLAKAFGADVFATAGTPHKVAACLELGADHAIDYRTSDFVAEIQRLTDGQGVHLVLDMVGGDYLARNLACLAQDGRHVSIAFLRGTAASVDVRLVMTRRLTLTGSTLRARSVAEKTALATELRQNVWPLLENGIVCPRLDQVFPLAQAHQAHARMEADQHIGKIVLDLTAP